MNKAGICGIGLIFMLGCAEKQASVSMTDARNKTVLSTNAVIQIAKEAVAKNDSWGDRARYEASHETNGWSVMVWRIVGYDAKGKPLFVPGGHRVVQIDDTGKVKNYFRGE